MKTTQRILSALLVLAMTLAIVPVAEVRADSAVLPTVSGSVKAVNDIDSFVDGIPSNAEVTYLSDLMDANTSNYKRDSAFYAGDYPTHKSDTYNVFFKEPSLSGRTATLKGGTSAVETTTVTINGVSTTCNIADIRLGGYAIKYEKGLGANAAKSNASATSITFDTNGAGYFYAVVGVNGTYGTKSSDGTLEGTAYKTTFALSGKKAGEDTYTELASATVYWWLTAEFMVDISEYETIKLTQKANHTNGGRYGAWGNASFLTIPAAEEPDTTAESNIRFGSALSLLTRWNKDAFANVTGAQVTFKGNPVNATYTPDNTHYNVEYPGVTGKEMTEKVTVSLLNGQETVTTVSASVRDHALEYLAKGELASYKTALYHMLQFGAAAQDYFKYNTGDMANADLEEYAQFAMSGDVSQDGVVARSEKDANGYFYGTNLRLEDRINLIFYFEGLEAGCTARITVNGVTVDKEVKACGIDGVVMVEMDELAVADYKAAVVCTIYNGETEVVSVQDSVAGYAFRAQAKGGKLAAVCAELLKYAASVDAYLG